MTPEEFGLTPNASKDQEWRQQSGWGYSGILADNPAPPVVGESVRGPYLVNVGGMM